MHQPFFRRNRTSVRLSCQGSLGKALGGSTVLLIASLLLGIDGNAAMLGETCDPDRRCSRGLWCDPAPEQCAATGSTGTCVRVKQLCLGLARSVCGCKGRTYPNDCQRVRAKV